MHRIMTILRVLATLPLLASFATGQQQTTYSTTTTTITSTFYVSIATSTLYSYGPSTIPEIIATETAVVTETSTEQSPTTSTAPASTAAMAFDATNLRPAILNSTNFYRAQYQAAPLTWNVTLASFAKNHSQGCLWEHSGGPYGENLAENFQSPTLSIDAWAAEEAHYNYRQAKFSEATGHFTQLVWKDTTSVGCGATMCGSADGKADGANGWYLVCEYYPRGNIVGAFKVQVTKPGESEDGVLGFGAANGGEKLGGRKGGLMVALAAVLVMIL